MSAARRPPPDWSISVGPDPVWLLEEVLNCHQVFRWLTRSQRAALLDDRAGDLITGHPTVLANLRKRGLVDDTGHLTEVGVLVRKWNQPKAG